MPLAGTLRVPPLSWEPIPKHHLPLLISKIYRAQDEDIPLREDFGMLESNVTWMSRGSAALAGVSRPKSLKHCTMRPVATRIILNQ